jgi:hypothetical protein
LRKVRKALIPLLEWDSFSAGNNCTTKGDANYVDKPVIHFVGEEFWCGIEN